MKKAQISLFIIVGIIVLFTIAVAFVLIQNRPDVGIVEHETTSLTRYVESCITETGTAGIIIAGLQGGRIILPDSYLSTTLINTSYGYYLGEDTFPVKEEVEAGIAAYVDSALPFCTGNFSSFYGRTVRYGSPKTKVTIGEQKVILKTYFPVEMGDVRAEDFITEVPIALGKLHGFASGIIDKVKTEPEWVDLSYLSSFPGIKVNIVPASEDSVLYLLLDDKEYLFSFGAKILLNKAPVIDMPSEITVQDGIPWLYKVGCTDPEGDEVAISDDTAMIDMLSDGSILTTPEIPGEYNVTFTCSDGHYNTAKKTVLIKVE